MGFNLIGFLMARITKQKRLKEAKTIVENSAFGQRMKVSNSFLFLMEHGEYENIKKVIGKMVYNVRAPKNDNEIKRILDHKLTVNELNSKTMNTAHLRAEYDKDMNLQFFVYHSYRITKEHAYLVAQVLHQMLHIAFALHNIDIGVSGANNPDEIADLINSIKVTTEPPGQKKKTVSLKSIKKQKMKKKLKSSGKK